MKYSGKLLQTDITPFIYIPKGYLAKRLQQSPLYSTTPPAPPSSDPFTGTLAQPLVPPFTPTQLSKPLPLHHHPSKTCPFRYLPPPRQQPPPHILCAPRPLEDVPLQPSERLGILRPGSAAPRAATTQHHRSRLPEYLFSGRHRGRVLLPVVARGRLSPSLVPPGRVSAVSAIPTAVALIHWPPLLPCWRASPTPRSHLWNIVELLSVLRHRPPLSALLVPEPCVVPTVFVLIWHEVTGGVLIVGMDCVRSVASSDLDKSR